MLIFTKCEESFFVVQIEKTEMHILQREWGKSSLIYLIFEIKRKTLFKTQ